MLAPKTLQNEADLDAALARIDELLPAAIPDTPEYAELQILSDLVVDYEKIHYPSAEPTPAGWIQDRLDAYAMSEDALVPILGSRQRVTAVLAGQQPLTPAAAEALAQLLGLAPELLLPAEPLPAAPGQARHP